MKNVIKDLSKIELFPLALICGIKLIKDNDTWRYVHRHGKVVKMTNYWTKVELAIYATEVQLKAELQRRINAVFGEHQVPMDIATYALWKGCEAKHIHIAVEGKCSAKFVSGTYFGSGSYCANFRTNGTVEEVGERDTGFAVEHHKVVHLKKGQCLFNWQSASPGRNFKEFFIAA